MTNRLNSFNPHDTLAEPEDALLLQLAHGRPLVDQHLKNAEYDVHHDVIELMRENRIGEGLQA